MMVIQTMNLVRPTPIKINVHIEGNYVRKLINRYRNYKEIQLTDWRIHYLHFYSGQNLFRITIAINTFFLRIHLADPDPIRPNS